MSLKPPTGKRVIPAHHPNPAWERLAKMLQCGRGYVNLWGGRVGRPMTYATVNDVVLRTRRDVGFRFTPHWFRHTYATLARRNGVPIDVISQLITHRSVQTTQQTYTHLDVEDLRSELQRAGLLGMVEDLL